MKTMNKVMMVVSLGLASVVGAIVLQPEPALVAADEQPTSQADDAAAKRRAARIFQIATQNPSLGYDRAEALVDQSDQMRRQLEAEGEDDLGDAVRERLAGVEIDEVEAVAWFEAHRELFGERSFEQSRHTVERLIAIERVREEFALL